MSGEVEGKEMIQSAGKMVPKYPIVRCPKCRNLLQVPAGYGAFKCGGCATILQGKNYSAALPKRGTVKLPNMGPELDKLPEALRLRSEVFQTSLVVPDVVAQDSQRDTLDLQVSLRDPRDPQPIIPEMRMVCESKKRWRLVELIICVIALTHSICSTGELIAWRFFIFEVPIMVLIFILFEQSPPRFVRHVWNKIKGFSMQALRSSSQGLQTSPIVIDAAQGSRRDLNLQLSLWDPVDPQPTPLMQLFSIYYKKNNIWRTVGLVSSVVGLACFALSPSSDRLIGGWNIWKILFYHIVFLLVLFAFLSAQKSSRPVGHIRYKIKGFATLICLAIYAYYYDKAVDGKPEIFSLVSNTAFALMSLSYSKLTKSAHEMGVFSFFLTYLAIQLWMVHWSLISVAICYGYPLYSMHSSSNPN